MEDYATTAYTRVVIDSDDTNSTLGGAPVSSAVPTAGITILAKGQPVLTMDSTTAPSCTQNKASCHTNESTPQQYTTKTARTTCNTLPRTIAKSLHPCRHDIRPAPNVRKGRTHLMHNAITPQRKAENTRTNKAHSTGRPLIFPPYVGTNKIDKQLTRRYTGVS